MFCLANFNTYIIIYSNLKIIILIKSTTILDSIKYFLRL